MPIIFPNALIVFPRVIERLPNSRIPQLTLEMALLDLIQSQHMVAHRSGDETARRLKSGNRHH